MVRLFDEQLIPKPDLDAAEAPTSAWPRGGYQEAIETARTRQALLSQRRSELAIAQQQLADSVLTRAVRRRHPRAAGQPRRLPGGRRAGRRPGAGPPLRLQLAVPEREALGVRVGQPVELTVEGDPAKRTRHGSPASARRSARTTAR